MDIKFFGGDEDSGDVFVVQTRAPAGYVLESHKHEHSHMSVLVSGTARVTIDGVAKEYSGYSLVTVPRNTTHKVEAITDIVWLCLWADSVAPKQQAYDSLRLIPCGVCNEDC